MYFCSYLVPKGPTYILGKTKIPLSWQTPYVLIDFKSVPENLTEDGYVKLPEDGKFYFNSFPFKPWIFTCLQ